MSHSKIESLVLLVGSNPLPNYLAAMALKPSTIHLVHTSETEKPKDRLREALNLDVEAAMHIDDHYIEDACDAAAVYDKISSLLTKPPTTHLHYTGGTKVMSAHAVRAFYDKNVPRGNVSYLDEGAGTLRFDDRSSEELHRYGLTLKLERVLQLHEIATLPARRCPEPDWVERIAKEEIKCKGSSKDRASEDERKTWRLFLESEWLEEWIRLRLLDVLPSQLPPSAVRAGLECVRGEEKRKLEVDLVVVHQLRTFVVSCTTSSDLGRCKQKAFEVAERARQLAGDLARSALVCFLDGVDNNEGRQVVDLLKDDVAEIWGRPEEHPTATRIWGLQDIHEWNGSYGPPKLDALRNWIAT